MTSRKPRGSGSRKRTPQTGRRGGPFSGADYDRNLGPVDRSQYGRKGKGQGKKSRQHVPEGERLQKVIAAAGIASRRVAEDLISEGRVEVNEEIVTALGTRVDPDTDVIFVDGIRVNTNPDAVYYAFNKPRGVISTMSDPKGRPSIADYVNTADTRLFHVGRLDNETEGLLLLTNDGELANRLSHPRYEIPKTYLVQVKGPLRKGVGDELRQGIELEEDGLVSVDSFKVVDSTPGHVLCEVVIHSGQNRVVRRLMKAVDYPVQRLVRVAHGPITLGDQRQGSIRKLNSQEVGHLMAAVGL
ncbi:pseudouridine synthase [Enteractinococcus fodinae]|uniref:Pseudouridine synthase n=1 Tax=Enteractinococcus fodinae TaxID=684663 RepID=A0ABU2B4L3_9MICC|nr:pseudouridine synthase [Enteractinococcus fodinae]MDR7347349.1 pseudouridine synthase [Enteractinococcus fodinae]